ncbi:hypothetical protein D3M59_00715 [Sphingomonas edaphi]|uniref:Uncharacterized protein n=1 Tax=Sphingomonas edaphi TaxID=2315689 RepID=A0A418Q161_9SPHN|nr:hypothetical protein D3M59_00715 [Sphingomonas edaphi]
MHIACGMLCFECDGSFTQLSISVIYNQRPIFRLDVVPDNERKENPFAVRRYAPSLPREVCGPHTHPWVEHREWVRAQGLGELPFRKPLVGSVTSFEHALDIVADAVNLTLAAGQRSVALPAQAGLFAREGGVR